MVLVSKPVFAVVGVDPNDGFPRAFAYYTLEGRARDQAESLNRKFPDSGFHVSEWDDSIYHESGSDRYWLVKKEAVVIDPPTRESVLAKLTDKELAVLGIKR